MLRVLDLFSGIGGFSLGLERTGGFRTVAFCEIEPFPRKVLAKHWPNVPIFEDVRKLHAEDLPEPIDVICGGYPCQPFSLAGKRKSETDNRYIWPDMFRIVQAVRPRWVLAENVAGHVSMGLDKVLSDLESKNYDTATFIIPACAVDAKHRRDRVWIIANANNEGLEKRDRSEKEEGTRATSVEFCRWSTEPGLGRVANGVPDRVDRLKSLGNAVVPQVVEVIGRAILEAEKYQQENT